MIHLLKEVIEHTSLELSVLEFVHFLIFLLSLAAPQVALPSHEHLNLDLCYLPSIENLSMFELQIYFLYIVGQPKPHT